MRLVFAIFAAGLSSTAFAQQQASPTERALGAKILSELNAEVQCSASLLSAQDGIADLKKQLDAAQAKIKDLQEKLDAVTAIKPKE